MVVERRRTTLHSAENKLNHNRSSCVYLLTFPRGTAVLARIQPGFVLHKLAESEIVVAVISDFVWRLEMHQVSYGSPLMSF